MRFTKALWALRLILGLNLLIHGWVRIPALGEFAQFLSQKFAPTPLPGFLVYGFAMGLPFFEIAVGLMLITGIALRLGAYMGLVHLLLLLVGSGLIQNWDWMGVQMVYGLFYVLLFGCLELNSSKESLCHSKHC